MIMNHFRYEISLRIKHPDVSPEEISTALSLTPSHSWKAGDMMRIPQDKLLKSKQGFSYWSCRFEEEADMTLSERLESLTSLLEERADFLGTIHRTGGTIEYFIGWFSGFNSGDVFSHGLLQRLAALHIDLALDVYGSTSGDHSGALPSHGETTKAS
jgi:Domain of unknown function (DUF4279)